MGWFANNITNIVDGVSHAFGFGAIEGSAPAPYLTVNALSEVVNAIEYARNNGFPPKLADALGQLDGAQPHNMVAADLSGFQMTAYEFDRINAPHANMAYAQISVEQGADVALHDVNINGGQIESANGGLCISGGFANGLITAGAFSNMKLDHIQGAGMRVDAHVSNMHAVDSHLPGFNADGATFTPVSQFKDSYMPMASFRDANMVNVSFVCVDLRDADFTNAHIDGVDFTGSDLRGAKGLPSIAEMKARGVKGLDALAPGSLVTRDDGSVEIAAIRGESLTEMVHQASLLATLEEQLTAGRANHWEQESAQRYGFEDAAKACGHAINNVGAGMSVEHMPEGAEVSSAGVAMSEGHRAARMADQGVTV